MSDHLPVLAGRDRSGAALPGLPPSGDVLFAWLAGRKPDTLRAYARDLEHFARYLKAPSAAAAVELLLAGGSGQANAIVLGYRAAMAEQELATATIARRVAAVRSMVKTARLIGRITWTIDVEAPRIQPYRDTRGPGPDGWQKIRSLVQVKAEEGEPTARRDLAILLLLHDLGLRRGELAALDLLDLDVERAPGTVRITGKGKTEQIELTLNLPVRAALCDWLAIRGADPGPLFFRLDRAAGGRVDRLSGRAIHYLVSRWADRAGVSQGARPHGLRHQAITMALDLTAGDVRKVRAFSRHSKLETLMRYDDNRRDEAGAIARMLGSEGARLHRDGDLPGFR
jgi:integrase/recombinase XerC